MDMKNEANGQSERASERWETLSQTIMAKALGSIRCQLLHVEPYDLCFPFLRLSKLM